MFINNTRDHWRSILSRYLPRLRDGIKELPRDKDAPYTAEAVAQSKVFDDLQGWEQFGKELLGFSSDVCGDAMRWRPGAAALFNRLRRLTYAEPAALELLATHHLHPASAWLLSNMQSLRLWDDHRWRLALATSDPAEDKYASTQWDALTAMAPAESVHDLQRRCKDHEARAERMGRAALHEAMTAFLDDEQMNVIWLECGLIRGMPENEWAFESNFDSQEKIADLACEWIENLSVLLNVEERGMLLKSDFSKLVGHRLTLVLFTEHHPGFNAVQQCNDAGASWGAITNGLGCFYTTKSGVGRGRDLTRSARAISTPALRSSNVWRRSLLRIATSTTSPTRTHWGCGP